MTTMSGFRTLTIRVPFLVVLGMGLLLFAGCEEDDPEVETGLSGAGTIDSPYLIEAGTIYEDVPIEKGGTLFFIALQVPTGWNELSTSTAVDIDLGVGGFHDYFGDGVGGSGNPDTGNESFGVLGDGTADLYFQVAGNKVRTNGATFDISVQPADTGPDPITVSLAAAGLCGGGSPPSPSCDTTGTHSSEFDLGFATAPEAVLDITIDGSAPNPAFFRTSDCGNCGSGNNVPFTENGGNNYGSGSGGFCHKNLGTAANPETCTVNPVSGYDGPRMIRIVNNSSILQDITVTFSTP